MGLSSVISFFNSASSIAFPRIVIGSLSGAAISRSIVKRKDVLTDKAEFINLHHHGTALLTSGCVREAALHLIWDERNLEGYGSQEKV
ncbi:hypothetical protein D3C87_1540590 [compost metagenome]